MLFSVAEGLENSDDVEEYLAMVGAGFDVIRKDILFCLFQKPVVEIEGCFESGSVCGFLADSPFPF